MNDQLQLPPEGRLTDQQRAVMRAELMAATQEPVRRPGRWLVPASAAATVALLVGVGLALQGNDDRAGTTGVPVAGSDSGAPSPTTPTSAPTASSTDATVACASAAFEVATDNQVPIRGEVTVADSVAYDGGRTYLLTVGDKWVLCDEWGSYSQPTVFSWHGTTETAFTQKTFEFSTNTADDGTTQFVAGGAALPGVTAIRYVFPTGDVVDATITEHMWQMVFTTADLKNLKPFLAHPVVVTVVHTDGATDRYKLGAEDMCAQRNHGC
jgi:hypothetical protein